MAVQVDQAGRHQLARGIEHALRPLGRNIGLDRLDQPEADADIAAAAQRLADVEHVAALDDEIELVVRPHGGARRPGHGGGKRERSGTCQKRAA